MTALHHETDDRYFRAAMRELLGDDFVLDANVNLFTLSEIAQRAAELKVADQARRAPKLTLELHQERDEPEKKQ